VFHPDVQEQRPFAVLADLDEPGLEGVVLVVGDFLIQDGVVDRLDDAAG
jgi:hypothetical protein